MARFYGTLDGSLVSSGAWTALEASTAGNRFQRRQIVNGPTLQANLISTRAALSSALYATLDAANRRGDTGIFIPRDGITDNGTTLSGDLFTNAAAVWPADPRSRPTAELLVGSVGTSTSPADAWSVSKTLYADASAAVEAVITALGVRNRLGTNPWRTLASLWHDHALTFFAWDDFTPGLPQAVDFASTANGPGTTFSASVTWQIEFPADVEAETHVSLSIVPQDAGALTGPGNANFSGSVIIPAGATTANFTVTGGLQAGSAYNAIMQVFFRAASPFQSDGAPASATQVGVISSGVIGGA